MANYGINGYHCRFCECKVSRVKLGDEEGDWLHQNKFRLVLKCYHGCINPTPHKLVADLSGFK